MNNTLFIRLLQHEDKGPKLAEQIKGLHGGGNIDDIYIVNPNSFEKVPLTPFCYWVSERIRNLFADLPPFEGQERTVKVGLQTGDDFRFVRAWWEVPAERILDGNYEAPQKLEDWTKDEITEFQTWCCRRTCEGKIWAPFAKGGEYSPYYIDIHLLVNWGNEGDEIRNFIDLATGKLNSRPQNVEYYFLPGLTWGDRTSSMLSVKPWPAAGVFSVKGSAGFFEKEVVQDICGLMNTKVFNVFLEMMVSAGSIARSYQVGVIGAVPYPIKINEGSQLGQKMFRLWTVKRSIDTANETSHAFIIPMLCQVTRLNFTERGLEIEANFRKLQSEINQIQDEIDEAAFKLYDFTKEECNALNYANLSAKRNEEQGLDAYDEPEFSEKTTPNQQSLITDFMSWCFGLSLGRFELRLSLNHTLNTSTPSPFSPLPACPVGMLLNVIGLPATPNNIVSEEWLRARPDANSLPPEGSVKNPTIKDEEYPIRISWEGILVDDAFAPEGQTHQEDIIRRVREVLDVLWGERAAAIEQEACEILEVKSLRDYFRKPSGFFQDHLKRYSKSRRQAPIYWPLSSENGNYTLWIYYHRLNDQFLYTCVNDYLNPRIEEVSKDLDRLRKQMSDKPGLSDTSKTDLSRIESLEDFLLELKAFREELLRVAQLPYKPDLNDGVLITAAPLWKLFRLPKWRKDLMACWDKLKAGDYDWAHLAYAIWPDRVRGKCVTDKSLAIAHDLEALYDDSKAPRRKRAKPQEEDEEDS